MAEILKAKKCLKNGKVKEPIGERAKERKSEKADRQKKRFCD
jgi:hypothetical protein